MSEESSNKSPSIAIDGPAGAGKSTTARLLAARLGFVYVDSGAMYRAVAWRYRQIGAPTLSEQAVADATRALDIKFEPPAIGSTEQRVIVDGVDVTREIRTPDITKLASTISALPSVRELLVAKQRALGEAGGVVMEGRDIGTVVLPEAEVKIFLTASLEERARRRFLEMELKGGTDATLPQVRDDIAERDRRDSTREVSPLMPADDAVIVDSELMTAAQVVDTVLDVCTKRLSDK